MLSFRQKIFLSYIAVFFLFIALLFPFATRTVNDIVAKSMVERADELIDVLRGSPDDFTLVSILKQSKHKVFFRVGVYNEDRKILYDSHTKRKLGPKFSQDYVVDHPEVNEAYETGLGKYEDYSDVSEQKMYYLAKAFTFHDKTYVLRVAVPYQYILDFTQNFEIGFLGLATAVLLLFTFMTWFIINHLTNPIQQIITAVRPYQEGEQTTIPRIHITSTNPNDDFGRLANTMNSLSEKIQEHIDTLTYERNEKLSVLESLIEGVMSFDADAKAIYANSAALEFLDVNRDKMTGSTMVVTQMPQCHELVKECILKQEIITDSIILKLKGSKVYFDVVAAPKAAGTGAVLVIQDQSSHHRILEMRRDFIANASHELKTPITIIRGFAETLHDNPDLAEDITVEVTGKIVRNCERMTSLIKDLLTLADIEHLSESRLVSCDLTHVIEDCLSMLNDAHPTAIVSFHKDKNETYNIIADPKLLELALINLMENAAKYSTTPAKIDVTLRHCGETIEIDVADQGIGISEEDLPNVFQRFYTVNRAHSQKMGGAGLGLSLVETIIEKHLGKISVKSKEGVGTTFTVELPVNMKVDE
ncbi:MAG: ATP-binding protein [Chlamydiota bacterium]|nr:ATP-binding protein [Chlamydiota bacterium]